MRRLACLALLLLLAACGGGGGYSSAGGFMWCVPYARAESGIQLSGDAWEWWDAAAGRYARGSTPQPGSVLVLRRTSRLRDGHLSVVNRVVSAREIRVDHANWASGAYRGRIATDQQVVDVSPANDWSMVRVWYPPSRALGVTSYPAAGFIHRQPLMAAR
ncbi:CHAP domain-containing protein [Roseomonas marmotae]|uniref:CHAP domain-containing protein n=1 Tax=Roseomonas marmotae TaxID=2768161 RepID=A0ABS3K6L7_9PROT|nr:CHAP domain-containing protein [Roseomonas marmotae]MBO1073092.1 CHAP domain-containing protein [Roseomonas marmotae]QTI79268.1 CHAP domain-containing protein [Roseomonas marmotae]